MEKSNRFWIGLACLMTGVVIGFLCAPVKRGLYCGNHNGNNYGSTPDADNGQWLMDEDEVDGWLDDDEDALSL